MTPACCETWGRRCPLHGEINAEPWSIRYANYWLPFAIFGVFGLFLYVMLHLPG